MKHYLIILGTATTLLTVLFAAANAGREAISLSIVSAPLFLAAALFKPNRRLSDAVVNALFAVEASSDEAWTSLRSKRR